MMVTAIPPEQHRMNAAFSVVPRFAFSGHDQQTTGLVTFQCYSQRAAVVTVRCEHIVVNGQLRIASRRGNAHPATVGRCEHHARIGIVNSEKLGVSRNGVVRQ